MSSYYKSSEKGFWIGLAIMLIIAVFIGWFFMNALSKVGERLKSDGGLKKQLTAIWEGTNK